MSLGLATPKIQMFLGVHRPRSPSALSVAMRLKWPDPCLGDTEACMEGGHAVSLLLVRSLSVSHSHTHEPPHAHLGIAGGVCLFEIALIPVMFLPKPLITSPATLLHLTASRDSSSPPRPSHLPSCCGWQHSHPAFSLANQPAYLHF